MRPVDPVTALEHAIYYLDRELAPSAKVRAFQRAIEVVEGLDVIEMVYREYRERPDQALIQLEGNAYLQREFPELDYIESAAVEEK